MALHTSCTHVGIRGQTWRHHQRLAAHCKLWIQSNHSTAKLAAEILGMLEKQTSDVTTGAAMARWPEPRTLRSETIRCTMWISQQAKQPEDMCDLKRQNSTPCDQNQTEWEHHWFCLLMNLHQQRSVLQLTWHVRRLDAAYRVASSFRGSQKYHARVMKWSGFMRPIRKLTPSENLLRNSCSRRPNGTKVRSLKCEESDFLEKVTSEVV